MITTLTIDGMRAVHCTRAVFTALTAVEGIVSADVRIGTATIEHDGRATEAVLRDAVEAAGYVITEVRTDRRRLA